MMELWMQASLWGLIAGAALLLGAVLGFMFNFSQRAIAWVMAFGSGVLLSALAFNLIDVAFARGGILPAAAGFIGGSIVYSIVNVLLARRGARHRKRSGGQQVSEGEHPGSGFALAVGSLLDDIPEAIAIGLSLIEGGSVSLVTVIAVFISNVPEGMSSSAGMKKAGRSTRFVFSLWGGAALLCGLAALLGYAVFSNMPVEVIAFAIAVAAGGILAMLADTMMPEAYEGAHNFAGLITVVGFLIAFLLTKIFQV